MSAAARLRHLDDQVLGRCPSVLAGPTPPAGSLSPAQLAGPIARYLAWDERHAARRPPDPRSTAVNIGLILATHCVLIVLLVASEIASGRAFIWYLLAAMMVIVAFDVIVGRQRWQRALSRSEAIYGPGWRDLSAADRLDRWSSHVTGLDG